MCHIYLYINIDLIDICIILYHSFLDLEETRVASSGSSRGCNLLNPRMPPYLHLESSLSATSLLINIFTWLAPTFFSSLQHHKILSISSSSSSWSKGLVHHLFFTFQRDAFKFGTDSDEFNDGNIERRKSSIFAVDKG